MVEAGIDDVSVQEDRPDALTALSEGAHTFCRGLERLVLNHEFDLQAIGRGIDGK